MEGKKKFFTKKKVIAIGVIIAIIAAGTVILPNMVKPQKTLVTTQKVENADLKEMCMRLKLQRCRLYMSKREIM